MFNWLTATSKPRRRAGAISVIYIGQTTEAPPTATPPSPAKPNPTASIASTGRRPHQSAGRPTNSEPTIVPSSALDTVKPRRLSLSVYTCRKASVVPEITAVSKPKSSDPSAATMALIRRMPPPPPLRSVVVIGDSIAIGVCIFRALFDCRHRAAILTGWAQCSNILMRRGFPRLDRLRFCPSLMGYGIRQSRFDWSKGFAHLPGLHDLWCQEMARMGVGRAGKPAAHPSGPRGRHQLLRYGGRLFARRQ